MSAPTPVSREYMRNLKAKNDEMKRLAEIERWIKNIYNQALNAATTSGDTSYRFQIQQAVPDFFATNIQDIIRGLQCLFPDCNVERTTLSRGQDGKMYDISKIEEKLLPFIDKRYNQDYIIIDWS